MAVREIRGKDADSETEIQAKTSKLLLKGRFWADGCFIFLNYPRIDYNKHHLLKNSSFFIKRWYLRPIQSIKAHYVAKKITGIEIAMSHFHPIKLPVKKIQNPSYYISKFSSFSQLFNCVIRALIQFSQHYCAFQKAEVPVHIRMTK